MSRLAAAAGLAWILIGAAATGAGACDPFGAESTTGDGGDGGGGADASAGPGRDGAAPFEAGSATGCPTGSDIVWCDDFESSPGPPDHGWTDSRREAPTNQMTIEIAAGEGVGGSRALRISVTSAINTWLRRAMPNVVPNSPPRTYELDLDFRVEPLTSGSAIVAGLWVTSEGDAKILGVRAETNPAELVAYPSSAMGSFTASPFGAWHHAHIELTPSTAGGASHQRKIVVDSQTIATDGFDITGMKYPDVRLGFYFTSGQAGTAYFDNVVARIRN